MGTVESSGFCSRKGGGEGGGALRRVRRVLISQVSAAGRLSVVRYVPVAANYIPRQCHQGWGKSTGLYLDVCVIKRIAPYISLHRRFEETPDANRPTLQDGLEQKIGYPCYHDKVSSSELDICGAS